MTDALTSLSQHPLFSVTVTVSAFLLAMWLYRRSQWIMLQPVLVGTLLTIVLLRLCKVDYATYHQQSALLWLLLGPATVALAVPLYHGLPRIRSLLLPTMLTLSVGTVMMLGLTIALARLLGADTALTMSLAPKSVTSPVAILLSAQTGGIASLTATFVMITGVLGAMTGPGLLTYCGVTLPAARGLMLGMSAHAVGTLQALKEDAETGAFAALGMSLTGVLTALLYGLWGTLR
ncbi:membrane protein [Pokkaliibacter plantistimulans]|uniref:Membrane protein n=1 Tax=Pokkaliibacter plantistimulans TaxID=1635171 RepID=A0ABX5LXS2_9GAMM|nr:LrgB family protein [Pokkaliibacter plantistimulans]PXF30096.1 membrane protein [Pokkaliibacter plantistimulans]